MHVDMESGNAESAETEISLRFNILLGKLDQLP